LEVVGKVDKTKWVCEHRNWGCNLLWCAALRNNMEWEIKSRDILKKVKKL